MNAKYMIKLLEKCCGDARECHPNDARMRGLYFVVALANELDVCGEPLGPRIRALASPLSDADYVPASAAADAS